MASPDVIVVGGGVMGTSAALAVARRGHRVTLLEQFAIGHDRGSSHGASRILRYAYFEGPNYARMVQQVAPMWRAIESDTDSELMHRCGGVDIGPRSGPLVTGALQACQELQLEHELLSGTDIESRWPFANLGELAGVYQPDACILAADQCVATLAELAGRSGVDIWQNAKVTSIAFSDHGVSVSLDDDTIHADRIIVTAGPWTHQLLTELNLPLSVIRKAVLYFDVHRPGAFDIRRFPIYIVDKHDAYYYGFGTFGHPGVKVGDHLGRDVVDPDHVERSMRRDDESHVRRFVRAHLPDADGEVLRFETCLYTMTPDEDFIIDHHPASERAVIAGGFSGHGFKFGPLIGEMLADLAIDGSTDHDLSRFRLDRFA